MVEIGREPVVPEMNQILLGDNLPILRTLPSQSVPLIYIDPPFNTGRTQQRLRMRSIRDPAGDRTGFGGHRYRTELVPAANKPGTIAKPSQKVCTH